MMAPQTCIAATFLAIVYHRDAALFFNISPMQNGVLQWRRKRKGSICCDTSCVLAGEHSWRLPDYQASSCPTAALTARNSNFSSSAAYCICEAGCLFSSHLVFCCFLYGFNLLCSNEHLLICCMLCISFQIKHHLRWRVISVSHIACFCWATCWEATEAAAATAVRIDNYPTGSRSLWGKKLLAGSRKTSYSKENYPRSLGTNGSIV